MPASNTKPSVITGAFKKPFAEQVAFFRGKMGNQVPTVRWDDISKSAHDRAFMVAGAQKADLLSDLAAAVDRSISEGKSLGSFRKDFRAITEKHGWHGWTGDESDARRAWRTRIIYTTNASTSYAAGRMAQLREGNYPFWVYRHNDSVTSPRPLHLAWNGLTLPSDALWWKTHYTPNGWGCHCYVLGARSDAGARRLGGDPDKKPDPAWNNTDPKTGGPVGIDKGWDYAPGDTVAETVSALAKKTATLPPEIGVAFGTDIAPHIVHAYEQWIDEVLNDPVKRRRLTVLAVMDAEDLQYLSNVGKAPVRTDLSIEDGLIVGRKAARHKDKGEGLTDTEWHALAANMRGDKAVLYDKVNGHLVYVLPTESDKNIRIIVEPDYWSRPTKESINSVRTVFKINVNALKDRTRYDLISGLIE